MTHLHCKQLIMFDFIITEEAFLIGLVTTPNAL